MLEWLSEPATQQGMKNKPTKPTRDKFSILRQVCNLIPTFLVPKLAREKGIDKQARTFSPWSHLITLIYAQLTHSISLNDVCDGLRLNRGDLSTLRGATPPSRNTARVNEFETTGFHKLSSKPNGGLGRLASSGRSFRGVSGYHPPWKNRLQGNCEARILSSSSQNALF